MSALRLLCATVVVTFSMVPAAMATVPIYSTGGRTVPNYSPPRWHAYQNYRGAPGYNVPRRLESRRSPFPQYQATPKWR
jgi:hypothetical protein